MLFFSESDILPIHTLFLSLSLSLPPPAVSMSADSFGAGGSDAQQNLQSFWPRVMEEIRNLTVVCHGLPLIERTRGHTHTYEGTHITPHKWFPHDLPLTPLGSVSEGFPRAGVASRPNQENHEAG